LLFEPANNLILELAAHEGLSKWLMKQARRCRMKGQVRAVQISHMVTGPRRRSDFNRSASDK
jgi:hypothetical protein